MDRKGGTDNDGDTQNQRNNQRRFRANRLAGQQRNSSGNGSAARNNNNNNMDVEPECATSAANANRRDVAAVAAAAAVAASRAADRNRAAAAPADADSANNNNPKLNELLQHLLEFCRDGGRGKSPNASAINLEKARNVLEACAGNVALAGQLYWDDYFATQQHEEQQEPEQQPGALPMEAPSNPAEGNRPRAEGAVASEPEGRVRRRLESDFERLLPAPPPEEPPIEMLRPARRRRRRRRGSEGEAENGGLIAAPNRRNLDDDSEPTRRAQRPRPVRRPQDNQALLRAARAVLGAGQDATEASVSVSDDEAGVAGVLKMVREGRRAGRRRRRGSNLDGNMDYIRDRKAGAESSADPFRKQAAGAGGDGGDDSSNDSSENEDDEDAYLSENDWLFTAASREPNPATAAGATSQPAENLRAPLRVLWSGMPKSDDEKPKAKEKQEDAKDCGPPPEKKAKTDPKNDDEGDDKNDNGGNNDPQDPKINTKLPEIPSTWLHASFSPDTTAMGLAIKEPKPEDVTEHSFRLHQISHDASPGSPRRNNSIPLPYHCRGISAILSIVNAMILTGTSVQSQRVTCSSSRVPFLELSESERKREFESRLIDALTSLIQIAATASYQRKQKAISKRVIRKNRKRKRQMKMSSSSSIDEEDTEVSDCLQKGLERKMKLVPASWWKENPQGIPIQPEEQWEKSLETDSPTSPRVQVSVTYGSNPEDIRGYVLSNMQSFTAPGGVALLLEAIVSIHGEGAVKRMLRKSRESAAKSGDATVSSKPECLVHCTCQERQKERLKDLSLSAAERRKLTNSLDTTPPGHECVSIELISLLLTGKIHSSLKGWTTGPLDFGILSNKAGEVGRSLSRPPFPVWCLRGATCYSVLYLNYTVHGENLDQTNPPLSSDKGKSKGGSKNKLGPSKPKAAPCMKTAMCSTSSRSRDFAEARAFASTDHPGYVANLEHWNPWFGVRHKSGLRLITARAKWSPPQPSSILEQYKANPNAKHSYSLSCEQKTVKQQLREKRKEQMNVVSSEDEQEVEPAIDEAALARVRLHPEDAKFYPKQHRLWRFDMGEAEDVNKDPNSKPRGDHWRPYHSLSSQEKMIVETKFGPQINRILWTRWPGANIDKFTPEGKKEPLPIV